jgi:hypothetical protein
MTEKPGRSQEGIDARRVHLDAERLGAYLDNGQDGLRADMRAHADAHLASCAHCRAALRELAAMRALLRALPQAEPRRSFILTPELAAATGGPRRAWQTPRWLSPTRWATAMAAVIFALTIGLGARPQANVGSVPPVATGTALATASFVAPANTSCSGDPLTQDCLRIAGLTPTIFPTPTALPSSGQVATPAATVATDWRPLQALFGGLTLLGGLYGFVLPAFGRRRVRVAP